MSKRNRGRDATLMPRRGTRALIKVGYACNDGCVFCHSLEQRDVESSGASVDRKIERAARLGHSMIVLSGGEPTIRPELMRWAGKARALGLSFGLVTNGRRLADRELAEDLFDLGLSYAYVSLHGGTAEVHDAVVRTKSFEETTVALDNLSRMNLELTINCVVNRLNLDRLREWAEHVLRYEGARLKLSMTEPKGAAEKSFDAVVPTVSEAARAVSDAIRCAESIAPGSRLLHDGFPLCLLPGLEDRFDDLWTHGFTSMSEALEEDLYPVDDDNRVRPPLCDDCVLHGACPGLFRTYHERHGHHELKPQAGLRSNSFNLVPVRALPWRRDEPCPVRGETTHYDRARALFLRNGECMTLFSTTSRDFSRDELFAVKYHHGQIYVDASEKDAPSDFSEDLLKTELLPVCRDCKQEHVCPGCYRVTRRSLFEEDDEIVRDLISRLRGDVLDLGCGEMPYADVLEPLALAGRISYLGVDSNEHLVESLRAQRSWASVKVAKAESLSPPARSLDHVLILRSYNHLERPWEVLASMAEALREGGSLIIVDNVAFGLLRTPHGASRAERSKARLEHHRNHSARQAAEGLLQTPLVPILAREATPETSNQWVLVYHRPPSRVTDKVRDPEGSGPSALFGGSASSPQTPHHCFPLRGQVRGVAVGSTTVRATLPSP